VINNAKIGSLVCQTTRHLVQKVSYFQLTVLVFALTTTIIAPASNSAVLREDTTGVISSDTCTDLLKGIFRIRRRRTLANIVLAPAFHRSIRSYPAREGVTSRYLFQDVGTPRVDVRAQTETLQEDSLTNYLLLT